MTHPVRQRQKHICVSVWQIESLFAEECGDFAFARPSGPEVLFGDVTLQGRKKMLHYKGLIVPYLWRLKGI